MARDGVMLLLKRRFRDGCITHNALVVAENICRSIQRNTEHSDLLPKAIVYLRRDLQGDKFGTECREFDCILAFGVPFYWRSIHEEQNPCRRTPLNQLRVTRHRTCSAGPRSLVVVVHWKVSLLQALLRPGEIRTSPRYPTSHLRSLLHAHQKQSSMLSAFCNMRRSEAKLAGAPLSVRH